MAHRAGREIPNVATIYPGSLPTIEMEGTINLKDILLKGSLRPQQLKIIIRRNHLTPIESLPYEEVHPGKSAVGVFPKGNEEHTSGSTTKETIAFLEKKSDKPFVVWCSYYGPHTPITPSLPWDNRYYQAHMRTSGFGMATFDQQSRDRTIDCYRFLADLENPNRNIQFPGWPKTINQMDNYGRESNLSLPTIKVNENNQLIALYNQKNELVYNVRMTGDSFTPKVFKPGNYKIVVGEGNRVKTIDNVVAGTKSVIEVNL